MFGTVMHKGYLFKGGAANCLKVRSSASIAIFTSSSISSDEKSSSSSVADSAFSSAIGADAEASPVACALSLDYFLKCMAVFSISASN
jgi:hypothetical protein